MEELSVFKNKPKNYIIRRVSPTKLMVTYHIPLYLHAYNSHVLMDYKEISLIIKENGYLEENVTIKWKVKTINLYNKILPQLSTKYGIKKKHSNIMYNFFNFNFENVENNVYLPFVILYAGYGIVEKMRILKIKNLLNN